MPDTPATSSGRAKKSAKTPAKPAKKPAPAPAPEPAPSAAPAPAGEPFRPRVTVRMYNHGLGDCFLLLFRTSEAESFNVLIDCGVYKGTADPDVLMNEVAADVKGATGGRVDLLVVTHEHWDHMSGFHQAAKAFADMDVRRVWQAWTEDPKDGLAVRLGKKYEDAKARLVGLMGAAHDKLGVGAEPPPGLDEAYEVMRFAGVDRPGVAGAAGADEAYKNVRDFLALKNPQYLKPGRVLAVGNTGVKAFVLGPPASEERLRQTDITKADAFDRGHLAFFDGVEQTLGAAAAGLAGGPADRSGNPFDARQEVPRADAAAGEFFRALYPFHPDPGHPEAFRTIDDLAYESLGRLALRMDSYTNNTSLVLAFRLPNKDVLLFPGDAQGGNWKSWAVGDKEPLAFPDEGTDAGRLLAATVFYKVSHHGSHNATPRTFGLDRMTSPRLRAFVPVDADSVKKARYGQMPLRSIMAALGGRAGTGGGVFRSDQTGDPPAGFELSDAKFSAGTPVAGRPVYCETSFDLG